MLNGMQRVTESSVPSEPAPTGSPNDQLGKFAGVVLADTETTWKQLLGPQYEDPRLVLFIGAVQSTCGTTSSAVGPFYCPNDHNVYLDLSFFNEMSHRLGAPDDFAQPYVIAHEVGHHVQNLMGIAEKVPRLQRQASEQEGKALSVRMELQADCFAGVWGHHAKRQRNLIFPRFRGHRVKPPPSSLRTQPGNRSRVWSDDAADYRTLQCTQRCPVSPRPVCSTDDER